MGLVESHLSDLETILQDTRAILDRVNNDNLESNHANLLLRSQARLITAELNILGQQSVFYEDNLYDQIISVINQLQAIVEIIVQDERYETQWLMFNSCLSKFVFLLFNNPSKEGHIKLFSTSTLIAEKLQNEVPITKVPRFPRPRSLDDYYQRKNWFDAVSSTLLAYYALLSLNTYVEKEQIFDWVNYLMILFNHMEELFIESHFEIYLDYVNKASLDPYNFVEEWMLPHYAQFQILYQLNSKFEEQLYQVDENSLRRNGKVTSKFREYRNLELYGKRILGKMERIQALAAQKFNFRNPNVLQQDVEKLWKIRVDYIDSILYRNPLYADLFNLLLPQSYNIENTDELNKVEDLINEITVEIEKRLNFVENGTEDPAHILTTSYHEIYIQYVQEVIEIKAIAAIFDKNTTAFQSILEKYAWLFVPANQVVYSDLMQIRLLSQLMVDTYLNQTIDYNYYNQELESLKNERILGHNLVINGVQCLLGVSAGDLSFLNDELQKYRKKYKWMVLNQQQLNNYGNYLKYLSDFASYETYSKPKLPMFLATRKRYWSHIDPLSLLRPKFIVDDGESEIEYVPLHVKADLVFER